MLVILAIGIVVYASMQATKGTGFLPAWILRILSEFRLQLSCTDKTVFRRQASSHTKVGEVGLKATYTSSHPLRQLEATGAYIIDIYN